MTMFNNNENECICLQSCIIIMYIPQCHFLKSVERAVQDGVHHPREKRECRLIEGRWHMQLKMCHCHCRVPADVEMVLGA